MSLAGLSEAILARKISSQELVRQALVAATDAGPLNLFTMLDEAGALAAAVRSDERIQDGSARRLEGVPIVVKDNLAVAGQPLTGGSRALGADPAPYDGRAVERLRDAGAIVIGKANLHEFAFGVTSDNGRYGAVANPIAPHLAAGGSSGGTAAAVAAGIVAAGLGTDTGGSGRIPAAFCGCVGFRPTTGRYSATGVLQLTWTLDTVSTCATDVASIGFLDRLIVGATDRDDKPLTLAGIRLGVPYDSFAATLEDSVAAAFGRALDRLVQAGAELVPVTMAIVLDHDRAAAQPIAMFEAAAIWGRYLAERDIAVPDFLGALASPDVREIFTAVLTTVPSVTDYSLAMNRHLVPLRHAYAKVFSSGVDALVFPTVPVPPPPLHEGDTVIIGGRSYPLFSTILRNTSPGALGGVPGISIPFGTLDGTLPFGLELDGPAGHDQRLLAIAAAVERARDGE